MAPRNSFSGSLNCQRCVHLHLLTRSTRQASTSNSAQALRIAQLQSKALLRLDGPDSLTLLQGLTTANVLTLKDQSAPIYSAILSAPGRVMLDIFLHKIQAPSGRDAFLIEHDKSLTASLVQHLRRHILRSKVKLSSADQDFSVLAAWSPLAHHDISSSLLERNGGAADPRLESMGYRFLRPASSSGVEDITVSLASNEDSYKLHRIRLGVPEGPEDIWPGAALPMESNIDYMGGIDLKKGCYVGQELTSRTHHTGVIRKRIVPVSLFKEGSSPPASLLPTAFDAPQPADEPASTLPTPQTDIRPYHSAVSRPRPSGKMCSSQWVTDSTGNVSVAVGLALVRLEQIGPEGVFKVGDDGWMAKAFEVDWWARKAENIQAGKQR